MPDKICPMGEHSGLCTSLNDIKEMQSQRRSELDNLWTGVKSKVPWFVFIPLFIAILGMVSWQYRISGDFQKEILKSINRLSGTQMVLLERVNTMKEMILEENEKSNKRR